MRYIIAGYGKFGKIALERLLESGASSPITVIDPKSDLWHIRRLSNVVAAPCDVVRYLVETEDLDPDDILIPMVPFHLAAAYVLAGNNSARPEPLPDLIMTLTPNPFRIDEHTVACSRADFLCPDDCAEGPTCTVTGEPRDRPLYEELSDIRLESFVMLVQRSEQLLPGVGGYRIGALTRLAERLKSGVYVIATSCKCHAILTGVRVTGDPIPA
jgi:hypothetical protein